jgi:hypothetical protein
VVLAAASQGICRLWMDAINSCLTEDTTRFERSCSRTAVECHCSSVEPDSPSIMLSCDGQLRSVVNSSVCMSSGESDTMKDVSSSSSHKVASRLPTDTVASSLLKAEPRHSVSSVSPEVVL